MFTNLIVLFGAFAPAAPVHSGGHPGEQAGALPKVQWTAPDSFITGGSFSVHVEITAPKEGASVPAWLLEASAFTVNGKPLVEKRDPGTLTLAPDARMTIDLDLGPMLASSKGFGGGDFKLGFGKEVLGGEEKGVRMMQAAEKGLDFMKIPVEELSKYHVIMTTNRGEMEIEFWPDVAPNHVRNFLDLSYTGFYDGKTFHRVIPDFMIQGGDPTGTGTGSGPRMLKSEFNQRKHERGVLSMARSTDPNSASCQFFIMHKANPSLDGQYSAFGKLVSGLDVVDKIVSSKRNSQDKPFEPQSIVKATVIKTSDK